MKLYGQPVTFMYLNRHRSWFTIGFSVPVRYEVGVIMRDVMPGLLAMSEVTA